MQLPDLQMRAPRRADLWYLILTSLSLVILLQVIRVFVPGLVYAFGERFGQTLSAVPGLVVFLSPFLVPPVARWVPPRRLIPITAGGLAVLRFLMQLSRDINVNMLLSGAAIVLGLWTLALALASRRAAGTLSTVRVAQWIFLGMTVDVALQGAFLTWDYVWQPGILPLVTAFAVSALVLVALWQVRAEFSDTPPRAAPPFRSALRLAALGPFFVLEMLFFENIGFVASAALVSMEVAFAVVLIGNAIALMIFGVVTQRRCRSASPRRLRSLRSWQSCRTTRGGSSSLSFCLDRPPPPRSYPACSPDWRASRLSREPGAARSSSGWEASLLCS